jgi:branched-subunit amino acid aminotransferase/4-amino-4-deoxychorismate lyase
MASNENLSAIASKIAAVLAVKPEIFITHPAELTILRSMTNDELRDFAAEHGWRTVRRLGGRQIEFYNNASTRAEF